MPLTEKGREIKSAMTKQYGEEKGKQVFYASANKGTITGVHIDGEINTNEIAQLTSKPYKDAEGVIAKCDALIKRCDTLTERMDDFVRRRRNDANLMPNHDFLEAQRVGQMAKRDMTPGDWKGVEKFVSEEKREPEHKE